MLENDEKINKAILVEYLYSDEIDDPKMKDNPRCSYIVYAVEGTEVGDEIRRYLDSGENETDFVELDKVLSKAFGITDSDCCFYVLDLEDSTIEGIKKEVLDANDMEILDVLEVIEEGDNDD